MRFIGLPFSCNNVGHRFSFQISITRTLNNMSTKKENDNTSTTPQIWLMKNEPEEYSLDHLQRDVIGIWDGIRNYQARNFMRSMKIGDKAYFYYSSCAQPGIYGVMRIAGTSFPDPKALDRSSDYYDAKSAAAGKNPWDAISVRMECRYARPLYLPRIRELPLGECRLTARGNRLSIFPLSLEQSRIIDEELLATNNNPGDIITADSNSVAPPPPQVAKEEKATGKGKRRKSADEDISNDEVPTVVKKIKTTREKKPAEVDPAPVNKRKLTKNLQPKKKI